MIYVKMVRDIPVAFTEDKLTKEQQLDRSWTERWNWKSYNTVLTIATYLTAMTGEDWLPVDHGDAVSPRYDVVRAPKVGDEVSKGFNGDFYPDGVIVKITKKFTVTTSTGSTYRRRKESASWVKTGGTWGMVRGHIYQQNPHF